MSKLGWNIVPYFVLFQKEAKHKIFRRNEEEEDIAGDWISRGYFSKSTSHSVSRGHLRADVSTTLCSPGQVSKITSKATVFTHPHPILTTPVYKLLTMRPFIVCISTLWVISDTFSVDINDFGTSAHFQSSLLIFFQIGLEYLLNTLLIFYDLDLLTVCFTTLLFPSLLYYATSQ